MAGDVVPGDGVFSGAIAAQGAVSLAAFYVQATNAAATPLTRTFPSHAPTRECLVRFGDGWPGTVPSTGAFPVYRIWMTQATLNQWATRPQLHNGALEVTFAYNNERAVYNAEARYSGSPYTSPQYNGPTNRMCGYAVVFPADDPFLGANTAILDWPIRDATGVREQTAYWIADQMGLPNNHRKFVHLFVNGAGESTRDPIPGPTDTNVYEDTQQPNADFLDGWFPSGGNGHLFKIDNWDEYKNSDFSRFNTYVMPTLDRYLSGDPAELKRARYRWNWEKRAEEPLFGNYTPLFGLVEAVNTTGDAYVSQVAMAIAADQWMRYFSFNDVVGNWDSYGNSGPPGVLNSGGKNAYAYRGDALKWRLLPFDFDVGLGLGGGFSDPTNGSLFAINTNLASGGGQGQTINRMYQNPQLIRGYWRAMEEAADGPMLSTSVSPIMDAKYAALRTNGIYPSGDTAAIKTWISSRRSFITNQVEAQVSSSTTFAITTAGGSDFSTAENPVVLEGTAQLSVDSIQVGDGVNDAAYPVSWTGVTTWRLRIPLATTSSSLAIRGFDRWGNLVGTDSINISYTGASFPPDHPVINEWLASNSASLADPADGDFEDWMEIYNPRNVTIDLSGYTLTDDLSWVDKWSVPDGTSIPPGGFLLIWADEEIGQDGTFGEGGDLHANFKLSASGETIALFGPPPARIQVDQITFGIQTGNVSQGRYPDGAATVQTMTTPTPRLPNRYP